MGVVWIVYYFSHSLAHFDSDAGSVASLVYVSMDENTEIESVRVRVCVCLALTVWANQV